MNVAKKNAGKGKKQKDGAFGNKHSPRKEGKRSFSGSRAAKWFAPAIFLLAFLVYSNTLKYQYTCDDPLYTIKNNYVQRGISAFKDIVSSGTQKGTSESYLEGYRPMVLVNFALEKSLFGNSAAVNHFFNVLIYALLCALIFILLRMIFKEYPAYVPLLITTLFVLHPVHTEVVANIKSRDELLSMLFGVGALISVYKYQLSNKSGYLVLSILLFFLCPLSKESGLAYVAVIPLMLYFFSNASVKRLVIVTVPFVVVAGVIILIRKMVLTSMGVGNALSVMDNSLVAITHLAERLATNFTMLFHALLLLFLPITLSWDYSYNQFPAVTWTDIVAIASLVIHLGLAAIAVIGFRRKSIYSFAILFYFGTYFITSNLVIKIGSSFGERFLFVPSLAFCIALVFLIAGILKTDLKKTPARNALKIIVPLVVVFVLYAFKTIDRNTVWKNNMTLYESGVITSPNSARARFAYANELRDIVEKSTDMNEKVKYAPKAINEFKKGIEIFPADPSVPLIYYDMGVIYYTIGDTTNAMLAYSKSLQLDSNQAKTLNNYGVILFNKHDYRGALTCFKKAAQINADFLDAFTNTGVCYYVLNEYKNAIPYFEKSLQLNPANTNVTRNLSESYAAIGNTEKAEYYKKLAAKQ